jgi:hypothetical protein
VELEIWKVFEAVAKIDLWLGEAMEMSLVVSLD